MTEKQKALVLINLGTPKEPNAKEVRKFLRAFLRDRRVIDLPRALWYPILFGMIVPFRPKRSAKLYQEIWTENGSPIEYYTKAQTRLVQEALPDFEVRYAMSYSEPTIQHQLSQLEAEGYQDISILPLYPQYSSTTTGSVLDDVMKFYRRRPMLPTLRWVHSYPENRTMVAWYQKQIRTLVEQKEIDLLLFSYHGIPESYVKKGDRYPEECAKTTAAIMAGLPDITYKSVYQSKFGPNPWLTPALDATLKKLPQEGVEKLAIVTPGFVADCLETIEEIESENYEYFSEAGGKEFTYIHPLNEDPAFAKMVVELVENHLL